MYEVKQPRAVPTARTSSQFPFVLPRWGSTHSSRPDSRDKIHAQLIMFTLSLDLLILSFPVEVGVESLDSESEAA